MAEASQSVAREVYLKSRAEIDSMRRGGKMLAAIMREVTAAVEPGMNTLELDKLAFSLIKKAKARPAFLGLYDFPNTLCISVNEEIVHGIPGRRRLEEGDIVSIDCGLHFEGLYTDMATTVPVGKIDASTQRLLDVTKASLYAGIKAAKVGGRVSDIGAAVEGVVKEAGYFITENYCGHGVGLTFHEEPKVFNTAKPRGIRLSAGMTLAVEPMVNIGTSKAEELEDGWTVVTKDRSLSAHFEHTIAILKDGVEILTQLEDER